MQSPQSDLTPWTLTLHIPLKLFSMIVLVPNVDCPEIIVTGSDYAGYLGTYFISSEKAIESPSRPVYKKPGFDRFIFYNPTEDGWKIGKRVSLYPGDYEGHWGFKSMKVSNKDVFNTCMGR